MRYRFIIFALALLSLTACVEQAAPSTTPEVYLSREVKLTLPAYNYIGRAREVRQLVTAHYGDKIFVFEARISITPERFLMVSMDPLGRKALTITWNRAGIIYEPAPWIPAELHPENILADIVVLYWPQRSLKQLLTHSSGRLVTRANHRTVMSGDNEIIRATYKNTAPADLWSGEAHYENTGWGYTLDIQSVETH